MDRRVIFLDVDGVLNHKDWYEEMLKEPHDPDRHWDRQIDPACVARLLRLAEETGADVVLSSTWRGMPKTEAALSRAGITWVDITPHHHGKGRRRGNEIAEWMRKNGVYQGQVVILDDDSDMLHLMSRLVRTDAYNGGLTDAHVEAAIKLFQTS